VQFKGSGWYVTDYAGKKAGADGAGEKKEEKPAGKEKDPETKPKKTEAKKSTD